VGAGVQVRARRAGRLSRYAYRIHMRLPSRRRIPHLPGRRALGSALARGPLPVYVGVTVVLVHGPGKMAITIATCPLTITLKLS